LCIFFAPPKSWADRTARAAPRVALDRKRSSQRGGAAQLRHVGRRLAHGGVWHGKPIISAQRRIAAASGRRVSDAG